MQAGANVLLVPLACMRTCLLACKASVASSMGGGRHVVERISPCLTPEERKGGCSTCWSSRINRQSVSTG